MLVCVIKLLSLTSSERMISCRYNVSPHVEKLSVRLRCDTIALSRIFTVKALKYAKSNGANVIAITDSKASPIAKYADSLLLARSDMASFVDSLVAPLSLINALIVAVSIRNIDRVSQTFERLEKVWAEYDVYAKSEEDTQ